MDDLRLRADITNPKTVEEEVTLDLSNILQGTPADKINNSLEGSMMMGASVDESFEKDGFGVPELPEPKLGECRPAGTAELLARAAAVNVPQPPRTVFFPSPPVGSNQVVYHAGHHQGWSQRVTARSLSPKVVGLC
jgi:hypothetical protein